MTEHTTTGADVIAAIAEDQPSDDIRQKMSEVLEQGFSESVVASLKKKVQDIIVDIETDIEFRLKEDMSWSFACWVQSLADRAVKALLRGDIDKMRDYLSASENHWTGRDRGNQILGPVIHGTLTEYDPILLRKQIVEAHADLLKNERILDLESQIAALVKQVNGLEAQNANLSRRLRELS